METFFDFIMKNLPTLICLIVGISLLLVEVFLPGFGLPGISGMVLMIVSVVLVWMEYGAVAGMVTAFAALALAGVAISFSLRSAAKGKLSKSPLILPNEGLNGPEDEEEMKELIGKEGVTLSVMRPAGIAEFDGVRLNVVSDGTYIEKDAKVRVSHIEGNRIVVKEIL